jgi:hypothetical protein
LTGSEAPALAHVINEPETITMTLQNTNAPQARTRTFEDIGVKFLTDHAGKIYLLLLLTSIVVVAIQEQLL